MAWTRPGVRGSEVIPAFFTPQTPTCHSPWKCSPKHPQAVLSKGLYPKPIKRASISEPARRPPRRRQRVARSSAARRASGPPAMSGPKRERDPVCDVCGHCHVQGVKCTICGHVGKYIGAACRAHPRAHTHTSAHTHTHIHTHTCTHLHTPAHTCTHLHTPAHTCTHISAQRQHAERRLCCAVPGGPNRPNRGAIPPVPPGPVHSPNLTPPTIEGITVAEFQRVSCRTRAAAHPLPHTCCRSGRDGS